MISNINSFVKVLNCQTINLPCLSPNLLCTICKSVLKNAKQTSCGCRMCEKCITHYLSDGPKPCPSKQLECGDILLNMKDVQQDNAANKEIGNLIIKCPFDPCEYSESVRKMVDHVDTCEYREMECERCKTKFQITNKKNHDENKCEMRTVICEYCTDQMSFKCLHEVHLNCEQEALCSRFKGTCPNECEIKDKVILKEHLKVCSNKKLECPFTPLKCDSSKMTKQDLISHLKDEYISHSYKLVEQVSYLNKRIENLSSEIENQKEITKEIIHMTSASTKSYMTLQKSIESLQTNPPPMKQTITRTNTFRNGNFIWKIKNFERLQNDAEIGSQMSVVSESFYTSEFGYKMCLKVYPLGDGSGKGTHLSVFFAIMRSEYDDLLIWPFKQKVTLSILDQNSGIKHHSETFKPDIQSICNQKPMEEYNTASGSPKFLSLSEIRDSSTYCKGDTVYLKFAVDTMGLTRP